MKKIISFLIAACLLTVLSGCSVLSFFFGVKPQQKTEGKSDFGGWNPFGNPQKPEDMTEASGAPVPPVTYAPTPEVTEPEYVPQTDHVPEETPTRESSYEIFCENCTWEQARASCIAMGGHLVTINSAEEEAQMIRMAKDWDAKYVWIGGYTQKKASGEVIACWVTGEPMDYEDWLGPYEPTGEDIDGTPENCMMLWHIEKYGGYGWNDNRNDLSAFSAYTDKLYYICEFDDGMKDVNAP